MLDKLLQFAEDVKKSKLGHVFFKKSIQTLPNEDKDKDEEKEIL